MALNTIDLLRRTHAVLDSKFHQFGLNTYLTLSKMKLLELIGSQSFDEMGHNILVHAGTEIPRIQEMAMEKFKPTSDLAPSGGIPKRRTFELKYMDMGMEKLEQQPRSSLKSLHTLTLRTYYWRQDWFDYDCSRLTPILEKHTPLFESLENHSVIHPPPRQVLASAG
ncbi:hypothetical protein K469DRAFT_800344 [Zopfia rhizophila CBS 207.26]|uniref:Uncharacterized protein n=1 Tax=Zopfia rhizophila CBS 207.26 TaxID=1314779 RepID=A0A6A6EMZ2_9PEZI|nr:hypothetical protein K469DRAFT_800344 [Zopfia rhizophila CBS 207.26]